MSNSPHPHPVYVVSSWQCRPSNDQIEIYSADPHGYATVFEDIAYARSTAYRLAGAERNVGLMVWILQWDDERDIAEQCRDTTPVAC